MRKRLYEIIEVADANDKASRIYDYAMLVLIVLSLIPLAFKFDSKLFQIVDVVCSSAFIIDYLMRLATADYKFNQKGIAPFIRYPFSLAAIIDLVSILPSVTLLNNGFKVLRAIRLIRIFRVFKAFRYSSSVHIIVNVFKKSKESLIAVGTLAIAYIVISALIIFNVEPDSFDTFFDAVYWATVSLTTVGYGDIYPVTVTGRIITMLSSLFGIAIVALPAGVITAGYMSEIEKRKKDQ